MPSLERSSQAAKEVTEKVLAVGVNGAGPWKGSRQLADEHLRQHHDPERAIARLIKTHMTLAGTAGAVTGLGGFATMPLAVPADLASLWILQGRLAGAIAHLRGYDLDSEEVRSVVLLTLLGSTGAEALSTAGIQLGTKSAVTALKRVPGKVLIEINKKVGFRLVTKAGTTGVVNLTKLVPVAGGVVGGGINAASTRIVGEWAKKNFPADDQLR